jgi:hypothetical protein
LDDGVVRKATRLEATGYAVTVKERRRFLGEATGPDGK